MVDNFATVKIVLIDLRIPDSSDEGDKVRGFRPEQAVLKGTDTRSLLS